MRLQFKTVAITAALLVSGCAVGRGVKVSDAPTTRVFEPHEVKLYISPPPKYEEVGMVGGSSFYTLTPTEQGKQNAAVKAMKKKAGKMGANGILLRGMGGETGMTSGQMFRSGWHIGGGARMRTSDGIAIYVPPDSGTNSSAHKQ